MGGRGVQEVRGPHPLPHCTELVLRQVSDQELLLSWSAVDYPLPLSYEVQVRTARPEHDFQQVRT